MSYGMLVLFYPMMYNEHVAGSEDFLLEDGQDFLLQDTTNFLLEN